MLALHFRSSFFLLRLLQKKKSQKAKIYEIADNWPNRLEVHSVKLRDYLEGTQEKKKTTLFIFCTSLEEFSRQPRNGTEFLAH